MADQKSPAKNKAESETAGPSPSRRSFLKNSSLLLAGGAVAGQLSVARGAHAYGSDTIKLGLVGCGGRGTQATMQALNTCLSEFGSTGGEVQLVAMADAFEDRMTASLRGIKSKHGERVSPDVGRFVGLEAYKDVMNSDCDVVILATPPGFRPLHFETAVNAGKHVFMEKPVATDAPGIRRVLAANEVAKKKGLAVQVGLQRHHEFRYKECVDRLQNGAIGDFVMGRAYWNGAGVWVNPRKPEQTETEYQMRNWYYFNWLCGDHITEQHIHNLDVINWVMDGYPVKAQGQGGRQVRTGPDSGQIYDHHFVEFTYDNGTTMLSQCRHQPRCWNQVSEFIHGTKGWCDISAAKIYDLDNNLVWESDASEVNGKGWQQEHIDLFAELRKGNIPNEGEYGAKSTMTSIMGRMATYSGKVVNWDQCLNSEEALADFDAITSLDVEAPVKPDEDGKYPIAMPGKYTVG